MNKDQDMFWEGFKIGAQKEFPELYKKWHEIGDRIDSLRDQIVKLEQENKAIKNQMPSWAAQAIDGALSVRCYAYYWAKQKNITVEEATKTLLENFKPQKKSDPLF